MKILILGEHDNQNLKLTTYHAVTAAQELGNEIDLIIIGSECQAVAEQAWSLSQVKQVFIADHQVYAHQLAENIADLLVSVGKNYDYILAASSTFSKNILPRLAALLDVAMISDVIKIISTD